MNRKNPILTVLLLCLLGLQQAAAGGPGVQGDPAAAAKAWELIDAGALVVDVRSAKEFAGGHIEGSVNIVHTDLERLKEAIGTDRSRAVVVYCRSGNRSGKAMAALEELGYTGVYNATGLEALIATRP